MPQMSLHYAAGRLFMMRRDALDQTRLERLLSAESLSEARRALSEIGWSGDTEDPELLAEQRVKAAAATVRELTTDQAVTDCFLVKYDAANLKMLIKSRCVGIPAERLSECGTLTPDTVRHAVSAHSYDELPGALRTGMETVERELITGVDPLRMDVTIDKAMFSEVDRRLKGTRCLSAQRYFTARRDIGNAVTLLRVRRMGRDAAFLREVLIPGGQISEADWIRAFEQAGTLPVLLSAYGPRLRTAAERAEEDAARLPALEKAMDDLLLREMSGERYAYVRIEYIIGYLLAAEREAAAVRLIMAAKANGFAQEDVLERLRELYVA